MLSVTPPPKSVGIPSLCVRQHLKYGLWSQADAQSQTPVLIGYMTWTCYLAYVSLFL
jgi:hypothetical protein